MNVSALESRYGEIPADVQKEVDFVWSRLQEQSEHVIGATFTRNFGIDKTNTQLYGNTVHKGLIVQVGPKYVVGEKDSWIHPNLNQCRSLYEAKNMREVPSDQYLGASELDKSNCSVGVYGVNRYDEVGDLDVEHHVIVDMHLKSRAAEMRRSWNGSTVDSVYSTEAKNETLNHADALARDYFGAGKRLRSDFTNVLYRGRTSFFFYNNTYKGAGLVLLSPLKGYRLVDKTDHAADYLGTDMIKVNDLDPKYQKAFYTKAEWNGPELVNTYVMTKSFSDLTAEYRMRKATFSTTPVHAFMSPSELLELTPEVDNVPNHVVEGLEEHAKLNKINVPLTTQVLNKLIELRDHKDFKIFNKEYYSNKKLVLPRHIVQLIVNH